MPYVLRSHAIMNPILQWLFVQIFPPGSSWGVTGVPVITVNLVYFYSAYCKAHWRERQLRSETMEGESPCCFWRWEMIEGGAGHAHCFVIT